MMVRLYGVCVLIGCFIYTSCDKEEIITAEYPRVHTLEVTEITEDGATFNAEILHPGDQEIIEYGFIWNDIENPDIQSMIIFDESMTTGTFSAKINSAIKPENLYTVKAYAKTIDFLTYGNVVEF